MKLAVANWEDEKNRIANTHIFDSKIKLDVGGHIFATTITTLKRFEDTVIGAMFSGHHDLTMDESGTYFIDRNGRNFSEILNYLRSPESWDSSDFQGRELRELMKEAEFYGLKELMFPTPPSPPPFVPAEPTTVFSCDGTPLTIFQGNDQIWYVQHESIGIDPVFVKVCENCGHEWPTGCSHIHTIANFTTDFIISPDQPKKVAACPACQQ